jgi:uncharacterized membrane protein (DUF485 family)
MTDRENETRRRIRRTTIILVVVALVFYVGFILTGVIKS